MTTERPVDTGADPPREPTYLVALVCDGTGRHVVEEHLDELERLVDTAGGVVLERALQERRAPAPATVVGEGFLERLGERCRELGIRSLVFDEDLTGSQVRNIERALPRARRLFRFGIGCWQAGQPAAQLSERRGGKQWSGHYFTFIGRPATTNCTSSAAAAII